MPVELNLSEIPWRKSSHSSDDSGDCVECAALGAAAWRKSGHSGDTGGSCVETARLAGAVAVRDSKHPRGPHLTVSAPAFTAFLRHAAR